MKLRYPVFALILLGSFMCPLFAQDQVEISPPELSLVDGKVHIAYRLINAPPGNTYTIRIEISNSGGNILPARHLSGDIGQGVSAGGPKTIVWDLKSDQMRLNEEIFVEIFALPDQGPPAQAETKEDPGRNDPLTREEESPADAPSELSRPVLMLNSLLLPGLGLTRYTSRPHWIKGVAAYGCVAGAVAMNRYAYTTYQHYLDPLHPDDKIDTFNDADTRKTLSAVLGVTAVAIWIMDLGWTYVATSPGRGMKISAALEPDLAIPMILLQYRF